MSLVADYDLNQQLHLAALHDLACPVPDGLPDQLAELKPLLSTYEKARAAIEGDVDLSAVGRHNKLTEARTVAAAAVATWQAAKTAGVDAQIEAQRVALAQTAAQTVPAPAPLAVQSMAAQLATLDPLEISVLYSDATEAERVVMEAAITQVGRVPRRRQDGTVVWETLLPPDRLEQGHATRTERADPAATAALRDLSRIRNLYSAMASAATSLLGDR